MREEEGGTYGSDVSGDLLKFPVGRFLFQVNFDADPVKKEKLIRMVYQQIKKLMEEGPDEATLQKVKQNLIKKHTDAGGDQTAAGWANKAWVLHVYGLDQNLDYERP